MAKKKTTTDISDIQGQDAIPASELAPALDVFDEHDDEAIPETIVARVKALREERGISIFEAKEVVEREERERRLDAVLADLEAAEFTHHPTAIRLIIKSLRAIVEEIR